jgi:hypothetical protein
LNTLAELFKPETETNAAIVIPDGGPKLTYQGFSAQIESLKGAPLAGGLTPGSFAASH